MKPTVFFHLPKTAGTAWREQFRRIADKHAAVYDVYSAPHAAAAVLDHAAAGADFVTGHYPWFEPPPGWCAATTLRDPVERIVSQWRHSARTTVADSWTNGAMTDFAKLCQPAEFAAQFPVLGALQTLLLAGVSDPFGQSLEDLDLPQLLQDAVANLERCAWFGIMDQMDAAVRWWNAVYGQDLAALPSANVASGAYRCPDHEQAAVFELAQVDAELLRRARQVFAARVPAPSHWSFPVRCPSCQHQPPVSSAADGSSLPKLIHLVWFGPEDAQPEYVRASIAEYRRLNEPHGWQVLVHTDASALLPELQPAFDRAVDIASKSDLLRYSILYIYGGWYCDADHWPLRPFADAAASFGDLGDRLLVSEQHGHRSGDRLPHGCSPMACRPGSPGIRAVVDYCIAATGKGRVVYGPPAITHAVIHAPEHVKVIPWPWFFPAAIGQVELPWAAALAGKRDYLATVCKETAGQLPYALHLWAAGKLLPMPAPLKASVWLMESVHGPALRNSDRPQWPMGHPMSCALDGLRAAGYHVVCASANENAEPPPMCIAGVVWNGRHDHVAPAVVACRRRQIPVWRIENGFFDRKRFAQCDHAGLLHWASWSSADVLMADPPPEADDRLRAAGIDPDAIPEPRHLPGGYVLVLGQVGADSQLWDSEIQGPAPLQLAVQRALQPGVPAVFRAHPQNRITRAPILPVCDAPSLAHALAGATLVVTINSNSIVEALAAGVPCLAFGPSTAIAAGVCQQATRATLADDIARAMTTLPRRDDVLRYLRHLACRQYRCDEIGSADFWRSRLPEVPDAQ